MPSIHDIVRHMMLLLDNRVSVDEFGDWMHVYTGNIMWEGGTDNALEQLACTIQSQMTSFDLGHIDDETLRGELANAIEPFSSSTD